MPTLFRNEPQETKPSSPKSSTLEPFRWLKRHFPNVCKYPFAEHHVRLWNWFKLVRENAEEPTPHIEVWPRGGAKSTTAELGVAFIGYGKEPVRKFCLYVSGTQEQADKHVRAIATYFERIGIGRSLNVYGTSKGWKRNQLRCDNGFNVEALGLDTAARGIKLDEFRPDLIIFDDIDELKDNPKATAKKIREITNTIIPAGSENCAILGIQNLIIEDGIFAQLSDNRAEFLYDRETPPIVKAVIDLKTERYPDPRGTGRLLCRVISGTPTWEGQNLRIVQRQINRFGLPAFLRESQHEVESADGFFFDVSFWDRNKSHGHNLRIIQQLPSGPMRLCRGWDWAATQGGGDWTCGNLHAWMIDAGTEIVVDVVRGQWSAANVRRQMKETARRDLELYGALKWRLPDDPGPASKYQRDQIEELLAEFTSRGLELVWVSPTGRKALRARGHADNVNCGNTLLVEGDWNYAYIQEHRKFREDETHEFDDQVDASADAHNEIAVDTEFDGWNQFEKAHEVE